MLNVNFVPDDYVKSTASRRTNLMYLVLLAVVMTGLFGSFVTIKMRQRAVIDKERYLSKKATEAQEGRHHVHAAQHCLGTPSACSAPRKTQEEGDVDGFLVGSGLRGPQ